MADPAEKRGPKYADKKQRPQVYPEAANDEYSDSGVTSLDSRRGRGVQNVHRTTSGRFQSAHEKQTVSGSFRQQKRARRGAARYRGGTATASQKKTPRTPGPAAALSKGRRAKKLVRLLKVSPFGLWLSLSAAFLVYIFQFWLSVGALLAYGLEAVAHVVASVFSFLSFGLLGADTLTGSFPGDDIGLAFFVLSCIIVLSAFGVFYFLFRIRGINPNKTPGGFVTTMFAIILSVLPVTGLFPWLMLWIIYVRLHAGVLKQ